MPDDAVDVTNLAISTENHPFIAQSHICLNVRLYSLPVFTVATGEISGIRFPQEGNVFLTWENE